MLFVIKLGIYFKVISWDRSNNTINNKININNDDNGYKVNR